MRKDGERLGGIKNLLSYFFLYSWVFTCRDFVANQNTKNPRYPVGKVRSRLQLICTCLLIQCSYFHNKIKCAYKMVRQSFPVKLYFVYTTCCYNDRDSSLCIFFKYSKHSCIYLKVKRFYQMDYRLGRHDALR
jgi:hypothetical protein